MLELQRMHGNNRSTHIAPTFEVHPDFSPLYHGYYLQGVLEIFGPKSFRFTRRGFPEFRECGLSFRWLPEGRRFYIDASDWDGYDETALEWADVYAKVNVNENRTPGRHTSRVLTIGPSFGVRFPNGCCLLLKRLQFFATRGGMSGRKKCRRIKEDRRRALHRPSISVYAVGDVEPDYIFHLSSVWAPEDPCNGARIKFIMAASSFPGIRFEGGFAPPARKDAAECDPYVIRRALPISEYLEKTKRSVVVFNTPSVLNCHGWKLPEYLALGKAIISTPLSRTLPAPLVHKKHLHIVEGDVRDLREAISKIRDDPSYRKHLEENARRYFLDWLHPKRVIEKILAFEP